MRIEHWIYTWPLRWRSLFRRREVDRDLDDEIRDHLDRQVDEHVARGVAQDEARHLALHAFGGVEQAKEACRDARRTNILDSTLQDLRYGMRTLRRDPAFSSVATLTLALGIGATTAVFSIVDRILFAELPYPAAERLVSVTGTYPGGGFAAMRERVRSLDVAAYSDGHWLTLTGRGDPVRLAAARVSAELFPLLGVKPQLGRWLRRGDDVAAQDRYVVLSDAAWEASFGRDPSIVGRSIELDGVAREVVAVMPPAFRFPSSHPQVWVPLGLDPRETAHYWAGDFMPIVGRLRAGATLASAQADVRLFQAGVGALFPWRMPESWNRDVGVIPLKEAQVGPVRSRLLILMAAVALIHVIACANVANLCLSRAAARTREMGIRTAIGAAPRRLARQLLTESTLLAVLGAIAGVLVATYVLAALVLVLPQDTPRLGEVRLSWRALAFAGVLGLATGCAFGLAPVSAALRLRVRAILESGGRAGGPAAAGPIRAALTIAQVACAALLVIAAGLLVRSLWVLSRVDRGFRMDQVVTARITPGESVCRDATACLAFYRTFEQQVRSDGGIRDAALVNTLPLTGQVAKRSLEIEGYSVPASETAPLFWLTVISPGYFGVMDIRVESGRAFTAADLAGAPVALITSSAAKRFWKGGSPIGRHVRFVGERQWRRIVGIVADVRAYDLSRSVPDWMAGALYVPHSAQATLEDGRLPAQMTLTIRTAADRAQVAARLRRLASALSADVVIDDVRTMRAVVSERMAAPAATTALLVATAAVAIVLGCVGVYGVLSFLVSRRTRDIGIRFALGAQRKDVVWLVLRDGAVLCGVGIVLGLAGATAAVRWLSSELHGVSATDPATYLAVAVLMTVVSLIACYVPTRRAVRVDPLVALRDQ